MFADDRGYLLLVAAAAPQESDAPVNLDAVNADADFPENCARNFYMVGVEEP